METGKLAALIGVIVAAFAALGFGIYRWTSSSRGSGSSEVNHVSASILSSVDLIVVSGSAMDASAAHDCCGAAVIRGGSSNAANVPSAK